MVGPSGSGKSTVINVMIAELKADSGSKVNVLGYDVSKLARRHIYKLRRRLGIVYQDYKLLDDKTAADNVAIPLELVGMSKAQIKPLVTGALEMVGL